MSKAWIGILAIIFSAWMLPTESRAYSQYAPPQPSAKRHKHRVVGYRVVYREVTVSRYIKPRREDYASDREYEAALRMNGDGTTSFRTQACPGKTIAADLKNFPRGTKIEIPKLNIAGKVDDRCKKAEKMSKKGEILFDVFSNMTQEQAETWGKKKVRAKIFIPIFA